ncbi:MAG: glycosyltransferase family 2 protein [Blautia sp.]|nr:glycosyltransferase family 2 protein [Blautia sp.]
MTGKIDWRRQISKLSPYTIKKAILYLRHYGWKEFFVRLGERLEPEEVPYGPWYDAHRADEQTLKAQRRRPPAPGIVFSVIVPVFHPVPEYLEQMVRSVLDQTYPAWELCLANADPGDEKSLDILRSFRDRPEAKGRIRLLELSGNAGISENTNAALTLASGSWLCFLDHDDLLASDALYEAAWAIQKEPDVELVYTDEDKVTQNGAEHFQPHMKPDFNLDLLRSNNYICHLLFVRASLAERVGGFRADFDGAQDYDFIFRCSEQAQRILHIPRIAYHWRTHQASTADNPASKMSAYQAGQKAIEEHLRRSGQEGKVLQTKDFGFYRVKYPVKGEPLVSIIIPNKDQAELLAKCLASLAMTISYPSYEILIVENNSEEAEIFSYYETLSDCAHIRLIRFDGAFNYAAINNFAAREAKGDYLLFLNNDVTAVSSGWLEEMLGVCQRREVGAVGVKLLYPDGTIQHAGIVVGMGGIAGSMFVGMDGAKTGYLHKASLLQDMSAVTAACMMVKRSAFFEVDGFTEKLAVAFNDVDLCLKLGERGYLVVYDPFAVLYHAESKTRGPEDTPQKVRRFQAEIEYMRTRWDRILKKGDPCYNPNLSLKKWNYSLRPAEGGETSCRR